MQTTFEDLGKWMGAISGSSTGAKKGEKATAAALGDSALSEFDFYVKLSSGKDTVRLAVTGTSIQIYAGVRQTQLWRVRCPLK